MKCIGNARRCMHTCKCQNHPYSLLYTISNHAYDKLSLSLNTQAWLHRTNQYKQKSGQTQPGKARAMCSFAHPARAWRPAKATPKVKDFLLVVINIIIHLSSYVLATFIYNSSWSEDSCNKTKVTRTIIMNSLNNFHKTNDANWWYLRMKSQG